MKTTIYQVQVYQSGAEIRQIGEVSTEKQVIDPNCIPYLCKYRLWDENVIGPTKEAVKFQGHIFTPSKDSSGTGGDKIMFQVGTSFWAVYDDNHFFFFATKKDARGKLDSIARISDVDKKLRNVGECVFHTMSLSNCLDDVIKEHPEIKNIKYGKMTVEELIKSFNETAKDLAKAYNIANEAIWKTIN